MSGPMPAGSPELTTINGKFWATKRCRCYGFGSAELMRECCGLGTNRNRNTGTARVIA